MSNVVAQEDLVPWTAQHARRLARHSGPALGLTMRAVNRALSGHHKPVRCAQAI